MSVRTDFEKWKEELRKTADYRAAKHALDFILQCELKRDELGLNYSDVARKIGVSRARINQLFQGDANMTIRTMQKLADALELTLVISASTIPKKQSKPAASKKSKSPTGKVRAKKPAKSPV